MGMVIGSTKDKVMRQRKMRGMYADIHTPVHIHVQCENYMLSS